MGSQVFLYAETMAAAWKSSSYCLASHGDLGLEHVDGVLSASWVVMEDATTWLFCQDWIFRALGSVEEYHPCAVLSLSFRDMVSKVLSDPNINYFPCHPGYLVQLIT